MTSPGPTVKAPQVRHVPQVAKAGVVHFHRSPELLQFDEPFDGRKGVVGDPGVDAQTPQVTKLADIDHPGVVNAGGPTRSMTSSSRCR